jgi:HSP20 family protein
MESVMNIARRDASPVSTFRPGYRGGSIDDQLGRMVESMFENMLAPMVPLGVTGAENLISPRVHIAETDKAYEIETELPGVNKNDVKINIDARRVSIEAEEVRETQEKEGQKTLYSERSVRHYARTFTLPTDVDDATAEARLENGVLRVVLPKKQSSQVKKLAVK